MELAFTNLLIVCAVAFAAPLALGLAPRLRLPAVVLEIVQRPVENQITQRGYRRFLNEMCDLIAQSPAMRDIPPETESPWLG